MRISEVDLVCNSEIETLNGRVKGRERNCCNNLVAAEFLNEGREVQGLQKSVEMYRRFHGLNRLAEKRVEDGEWRADLDWCHQI